MQNEASDNRLHAFGSGAPSYTINPLKYPSVDSSPDSGRSSPVPSPEPELKDQQLHCSWTLSYREKAQKNSTIWNGSDSVKVASISTIMEFWKVINHMRVPTKMKKRNNPNMMLFREGIEPAWEDEQNKDGGMWAVIIKTPPRSYNSSEVRDERIDGFWMEALLAVIGESIPNSDYINGIVLQRRQREDRIQIWTKNAGNKTVQGELGSHLKHRMNIPSDVDFWYTKHNDMEQMSKQNSYGKRTSYRKEPLICDRADSGTDCVTPRTPGKDLSYRRMMENIERLTVK